MGATVVMTLDNNTDKNFTFNAMAARGAEILCGSWVLSSTTATYDLANFISANLTLHIDVPMFVEFTSPDYQVDYHYASDVIALKVASAGTAATGKFIDVGSDTAITGIGGFFFAVGIMS